MSSYNKVRLEVHWGPRSADPPKMVKHDVFGVFSQRFPRTRFWVLGRCRVLGVSWCFHMKVLGSINKANAWAHPAPILYTLFTLQTLNLKLRLQLHKLFSIQMSPPLTHTSSTDLFIPHPLPPPVTKNTIIAYIPGLPTFRNCLAGETSIAKRKNPWVGSRPAYRAPDGVQRESPWQGSKAAPPCVGFFFFFCFFVR